MILVSSAYDGMPWLERVYQAGSLWDALEMGAPADVHCYTPAEFERKRVSLRAVRRCGRAGLRPARPARQLIATIRSIGTRARSAISGGTLTSCTPSRSESRSFGSVIIFM